MPAFGHFRLPTPETRKLRSLWTIHSNPKRESVGAAACSARSKSIGSLGVSSLQEHEIVASTESLQCSTGTPIPHDSAHRGIFTASGSLFPEPWFSSSPSLMQTWLEAWGIVCAAKWDNSKYKCNYSYRCTQHRITSISSPSGMSCEAHGAWTGFPLLFHIFLIFLWNARLLLKLFTNWNICWQVFILTRVLV